MRLAFIKTLSEFVRKNKNTILLTGDVGFSVFEDFIKEFPGQYINCGVAEQNMLGVAAGLALSGKKVFVYSIIPFVTMRPYEQLRNDICLQNLDVKIVGVGGGFSYGVLGSTHHALEDLAITRALPNLTVVVPADPIETKLAVGAITKLKGPVYLRLGKSKEEDVHRGLFKFGIGKANILKTGKDAAIIGIGPIIKNALIAANILKKEAGVSLGVVSMTTLKPLDEGFVKSVAKRAKSIFTIEEHNLIGGLGDAVAAVLLKNRFRGIFEKLGVSDRFAGVIGNQDFLRSRNNLSPREIAKFVGKNL